MALPPVAPALPEAFLRLPLAHRGLHDPAQGVIENSLSAARAAIAAGYGIECDLQLSRDGVAMVFHDDDLDRLTAERGPVRARTAAELGQIPLTGSQETIPTLAEFLSQVGGQVPLLIEIKDQSLKMEETDGRLEAATAHALASYQGPVAVMSFNPHAVAHLARLAPKVARGLTTCDYRDEEWDMLSPDACANLRDIPDYARTGASFLSHDAQDLARPRVATLKAGGAAILCWTIRSPEAESAARRIAQNITFEGYRPAL